MAAVATIQATRVRTICSMGRTPSQPLETIPVPLRREADQLPGARPPRRAAVVPLGDRWDTLRSCFGGGVVDFRPGPGQVALVEYPGGQATLTGLVTAGQEAI